MPENRLRRIAIFARFPRFAPRAAPEGDPTRTLLVDESDEPVVLKRACDEFPTLADALSELQGVLVPLYRECDAQALLEQNRHRRQQVLLIGGGLLTTAFGLIQAVLVGQVWPGIAVASFAAATAAVASVGRQSAALDGYLTNRLRAEQLRSAYFHYLAIEADHHPTRHAELREQVTAIRYGDLGGAMSTRNAQLTELYLRYRLAEQQRFYRGRAHQFQKARNQSRLATAALLSCASVAGALGGADVADARRWWAVLAGVLSALATALTSYEAVYGFDRLSREYERTIGSLARVEARFPSEAGGRITRADTAELIRRSEAVLTGEVDTWSRQTAAATIEPADPAPVASPTDESPPTEARRPDP